jgi:RNA polymerase sigma-70 factor (ECF subfamily)
MAFRAELADFGEFYERTYLGSYRTALAIVREPALASDVTQDAYLSAYKRRATFRGDAPGDAWLHTIVVNRALDAVRRGRPKVVELDVAKASRRSDLATAASDRVALFAALDELRPQQRAAVVLRYYHDYDYATIARILGTSTSNVGAMLSRALDTLRDKLEPTEPVKVQAVAR